MTATRNPFAAKSWRVRTKKLFFMRRMPTAEEELTIVPELLATFNANNEAIRPLVKAIVQQPAYRRLP